MFFRAELLCIVNHFIINLLNLIILVFLNSVGVLPIVLADTSSNHFNIGVENQALLGFLTDGSSCPKRLHCSHYSQLKRSTRSSPVWLGKYKSFTQINVSVYLDFCNPDECVCALSPPQTSPPMSSHWRSSHSQFLPWIRLSPGGWQLHCPHRHWPTKTETLSHNGAVSHGGATS